MSSSKKIALIVVIVAGVVLLNLMISHSSASRGGHGSFKYQKRQLLDSAKNTDEWIGRLELDLKMGHYNSEILTNLYAELPPKNEWPKLMGSLDELAGDVPRIKKLMGNNGYQNQPEIMSRKLSILSRLLKDGDADVETEIRNLIISAGMSGSEQRSALLMASKNKQATLDWIRKNRPSFLDSGSSSHSYQKNFDSKKTGWEAAFADHRIDDGIELLKKEIARSSDRGQIANHWQRLIRIGLLTDRLPLALEATEQLKKNLILHIHGESYFTSYYYRSIFDLHVRNQEWQLIIDTLEEIHEITETTKESSSNSDFGKLDEAHAVYLTALHQLGRTDDFIKGMKAAQSASQKNADDFFRFCAYATAGYQPVGVLYIDLLVRNGEKEKATAHLLHLIARNQGKDVYYEKLIELDTALARSFIESVRQFDPYEERPLIWQAELARRDGNLDVAINTIEAAIALDPSDGDHGKDSRMFCYEVLARVHEDAGRKDKADFFRSVVDSIRQGEAADDFLYAGLISEATRRYQKALGRFEDAYCLQSRLAMTLARNGQFDESVKHFKKAFELMPVSFGPRESHCFGCEGLFSDPRVIEIARPLLEEFEKNNPGNPRTPYLLGLVLAQSKNLVQAAVAYRRAFEIDPKYFNAATRLLEILEKDPKNADEVESLKGTIYAIAPYAQKPKYLPKPSNLADYWDLTEEFPSSPLDLPLVPFLAPNPPVDQKDLYVEHDESHYIYDQYQTSRAFEGWTPVELRRTNGFLKALDRIR
jgi:tetratricopeptide (TPR) repeat protein